MINQYVLEKNVTWPTVAKGLLHLSLEEKSTFFAAPEVMTGFSAAWCLSIVSQGVLPEGHLHCTQYNFASLRNCSGRKSVKGRRTGFFLHVELLQFLLFARSSRRSFLRTVQSIQQYGSTEWNWCDPERQSREFCGNLWNIAHWQGMKEQRNYVLQMLGELWF